MEKEVFNPEVSFSPFSSLKKSLLLYYNEAHFREISFHSSFFLISEWLFEPYNIAL